MQTSIKDILTEILTIAGYPNDKEKFIKEFHELNILEAMENVYNSLPKETQEIIKAYSDQPEMMKQYIPQDQYIQELSEVSKKSLTNFIHEIAPLLSEEQKEKISTIQVVL